MSNDWATTCELLRNGEIGVLVELQETLAATMALASNGEDTLVVLAAQPANANGIAGYPVATEAGFAHFLEMCTRGTYRGASAHLTHSSLI